MEQRAAPERKQGGATATESALAVSENDFRMLVESVQDYAIFMLDPSGLVASWNRGAERIKGYTATEIVGRHFSLFYPEEDIRSGKCEMELEVAAREGHFEDEGWRVRKDGGCFWANVVITALRDERGKVVGFAKVTRDLTERRRAEDERAHLLAEQKAREASDAANRAKDHFLAHVSHELRTPINAILGWSRLLAAGLEAERAARATQTIERNAEAMTKLIDDLLDVSRIISGKMRLEVESVDLPLVIERALESVKLSADTRDIRLHSMLHSSASHVIGDAGRLHQVVWNVLSNAIKFTPRGGRVTVLLRRSESAVEIVVTDSGHGIASEKLPHVFEPFWQGKRGPSAGGRGLGLGLAISRSIVEVHGGRIEAHSEGEGHGTTIMVTLPLAALRPSAPPSGGSSPASADAFRMPQLDGLRVLVVEDEEDARELLQSVLENVGCTVTTAGSVPEAMAAIEREPPDVLVSDIGLPGQDGYDLMRWVRRLPPERGGHMPAAAVTAYARGEDRVKALAAGFVTHVAKPLEPKELVMIVAALAGPLRRRA